MTKKAPPSSPYKSYLGDAVYADWDGMHIVLTVENGRHVTQRVCLDHEVWHNLQLFYKRLEQQLAAEPPST